MKKRTLRILSAVVVVVAGTVTAADATTAPSPLAVSPGSLAGTLVEARCPTFSWSAVDGAAAYELVVYQLGPEGEAAAPALREIFPGSVYSWTPPYGRCLERGRRYAWSVRAEGSGGEGEWSAPSLFGVVEQPEAALRTPAVVEPVPERTAARSSEAPAHTDPPALSQENGDLAPHRGPTSTTTNIEMIVDGGVQAATFIGDGSSLTGLSPGNLSTGTANIDITGSAANITGTEAVAVANGGTGASNAAGARTNLGAAATIHAHTESDVTDLSHTVDTSASTLCPDETYLDGDGTCKTLFPSATVAIFGAGTQTHHTGSDWVLEATSASNITLRSTTTTFLIFGITHPTNCSGSGAGGSADMAQAFRFSSLVGSTLAGTFCAEGSSIFVNVSKGSLLTIYRCWRYSGNANACQRIMPRD